ncbi:hypothetical protein RGQ29_004811 [Quercus rubra]|uniref:Uncharacterized protein n=1 Tax=Quercus rubra TaxID=3512 RepID=A0AAN7E2N8_QUERU|nr:hypothetical protein RGQ29_004811 [Quercus rubra]
MLEEAVEYVKLLQKQIQDLSEQQQRCKCVVKDFTEESIKDSSTVLCNYLILRFQPSFIMVICH